MQAEKPIYFLFHIVIKNNVLSNVKRERGELIDYNNKGRKPTSSSAEERISSNEKAR